MSQFVESLESRSLMSASVSMSPIARVEPTAKITAKAAAIPHLVGTYRGTYAGNGFFKIIFTSQSKGNLKGKLIGLAFAADPNSATLTVPLTGTIDAKGKFTATAKGFDRSVVGTVNVTYSFTGTAIANGSKFNGKVTIAVTFKGHGGSTKLNYSATKMA